MLDKDIFNSYKNSHKINLLIATTGLHPGGTEVVIQCLSQTIDRSRFNVTICCKVRGMIGDALASEGIDIVTLSNSTKPKVDYFTFIKLFRLIRMKRIDIVHTHTTGALADAAICKILMPRLRIIHTFHFGNYPYRGKRLMWMEAVFSRLANHVLAVGEVQRRQLKAVYSFRDNKIGRIWNGVQCATGQDGSSFLGRVRAENRLLIGTIATLTEQKGLRDLLAVARQFKDAGERVRFVIVGDGPMRSELEAMSRKFGLDDTVVFAGWVISAAELALPAFDVFFLPSLWEAMSISILEAMAAGKPIVATRVGEAPHIIEDGVEGLLVEPRDIKGMAAALCRLMDDADLRRRLGNAAARKVAKHFTVEHMTRAYEQVYLETR